MTARPLILVAGLAGLGLVLALRERRFAATASADLPQHPYPGEGDDGLPPVDAGLPGDWNHPEQVYAREWAERNRCDWRQTMADPGGDLWCLTHSSYHDGRQA